jgi:hypothetical protein
VTLELPLLLVFHTFCHRKNLGVRFESGLKIQVRFFIAPELSHLLA